MTGAALAGLHLFSPLHIMYDLKSLIISSGYSGVSGQSFRNHVAGSPTTGTAMSDYKCNGWSFSGEPVPETTYSHGQSFNISITFSQGVMAGWIKRTGSGKITISPGLSPDGFNVTAASSTVTTDATGNSATLTVSAPYNGTISYDGTAWFSTWTQPSYPNTSGAEDVSFQAIVNSDGASGTQSCSFTFSYAPDTGGFNPTLTHTFPLTMNNRNYSTDASLYYWHWSNYSDFSDTVSTSSGFTITSYPGDSYTYYLRGRSTPTGTWNNVGAVTFVDPRNAV